MKRDNLLADLKLLPENRRALELLNKADRLWGSCRQKIARHDGQADDAKRARYCEECQHNAKGDPTTAPSK
jgi:hypothetical protein